MEELLTKHGLSKDIIDIFHDNRINVDQLQELTSDDLKELGVIALGDRKRLNKATLEAKGV